MRDTLFHLDRNDMTTLQAQIREMLVSAMLSGQMPAGAPIPSTRIMAKRLNVSRNTVMLTYQSLAADGYLVTRERSGFFVAPDIKANLPRPEARGGDDAATPAGCAVNWQPKYRVDPAGQRNIRKPRNWHDYPYPFIYGQADAALFPIAAWRDCTRQAMSRKWLDAWTDDRFTEDDPMLVDQIHKRILPRRGILASRDEILVTMGSQNALYLIASLFVKPGDRVVLEDPGYPDARNIFALKTDAVIPAPVDDEGIVVGDAFKDAKFVFVTPSHQFPTGVTLSMGRRRLLLDWACRNDAIVIEDDYEFETNYTGQPAPALKSLDRDGRVLYVGSLSKSLMPGLRMGFMVAPAEVIEQARALRRLMLRHPPGNNQRVVALFLALGHHDTLIGRLHRAYQGRWKAMGKALANHFPGWAKRPTFGGSSFWVEGPAGFDARLLARKALEDGIVIEPGDVFFADPLGHENCFRLAFSSIPEERIAPGLEQLRRLAG